jgi:hypothetical protein
MDQPLSLLKVKQGKRKVDQVPKKSNEAKKKGISRDVLGNIKENTRKMHRDGRESPLERDPTPSPRRPLLLQ